MLPIGLLAALACLAIARKPCCYQTLAVAKLRLFPSLAQHLPGQKVDDLRRLRFGAV